MMNNMKFSVILVMYNPQIEKVLFTLKSVLYQKFEDFEIVISDDGSEENHFEEIEQYLQQHHFTNYVLVPHEKNQGTVKNLISALNHAKGTYVRDFGPGDAFYNENSMQRIYDFFENKKCEQCFGLMRGYRRDENGKIIYGEFYHPFDIDAYRKKDARQRVLKNLVLYSDNVSGACMCYKRSFYLEYLKKIENYVIYEEDIFQVLAAVEGHEMYLLDTYTVLYEMNTGVSTGGNRKFEELLALDVDRFYGELYQKYSENKYVKKRHQVRIFNKISNLYFRTFFRMFVNPDAIRYLIVSGIQRVRGRYRPKEIEACFLDYKGFYEE